MRSFITLVSGSRAASLASRSIMTLIVAFNVAQPTQAAKFFGLGALGLYGSEAGAVSANGSVVVGSSESASGFESFRWTSSSGMIGLGDLAGGGFQSSAQGGSADGSVVVGSSLTALGNEAFRWTNGNGMVGLGDLANGIFQSSAEAVSADGSVVVGSSNTALGAEAFRWTSGSRMVGLGDLAGGTFESHSYGVSADGSVVVGWSISVLGAEAFRWTSGSGMVGLGDLAGGGFGSIAFGVSADGSTVVGYGTSASGFEEAFRWTTGSGMVGLGDLAGGAFVSDAHGVSADGSLIVGRGNSESGFEASIWDANNGMRSVEDILSPSVGAALNGWTLTNAKGISADGRTIVGDGTNPAGNSEAWLAYMADQVFWYPNMSGAWDTGTNWTGPFLPGPADDVVIDPVAALTVTGPSTSRTVNTLTIGGSGVGRVTLRLAGATNGDLQVSTYVYFQSNAELVLADGRIFSAPTLYNYGLIHGTGTVNANLVNYAGGELRVAAGESLVVSGGGHTNDGKFEAIGGSLEFIGPVTNNASTGLITGRSATLRFQGGLTNAGAFSLTSGVNDVSGDIDNTGSIVVSGGAAATFYDDVIQNGTLRVSKVGSTTSVAVFLGAVTGAGGSTGGGDVFFEGDLRPGNSPASVNFENNVSFGSATGLEIELGGTAPGSQYDQVHVSGDLTLNGALDVDLINGFLPVLGDQFTVLTFGSRTGDFASYSGLNVGGHLALRYSFTPTSLLLTARPAIDGDINLDGVVDIFDVNDVSAHWGTFGPAGDANGDGIVDIFDVNLISSNWSLPGGGSTAVPEPTTWILASLAALAWIAPTRRALWHGRPSRACRPR